MYRWYRRASVCYAFLADYPTRLDHRRMPPEYYEGRFRRSRWFSRGWTLQELIAPQVVVFLTSDWEFLGTKASLADRVEQATGIDVLVLTGQKELREVSVARRLSWASRRITSVEEDHAYSLLGIFDINMPTLYGEGSRAFVRLQEEIIKRNPDQSLFAWGPPYVEGLPLQLDSDEPRRFSFSTYVVLGHARALFASAPDAFAHAGTFRPIPHRQLAQRLGIPETDLLPPTYVSTPYGIRTHLPVVSVSRVLPRSMLKQSYESWHVAVLACEPSNLEGHLVAVVCCVEHADERGFKNMQGGNVLVRPDPEATFGSPYRIVFLSPAHIEPCRGDFRVEKVYIPQEEPDFSVSDAAWILIPEGWTVHLAKWSVAMLREMGYDAAGPYSGETLQASCNYVLRSRRGWIRVEFTSTVTNATGLEVLVTSGRYSTVTSHRSREVGMPAPTMASSSGGSHLVDSAAGFKDAADHGIATTHRFTLQHFHEPHILKLQESPGHELTLRFAAICLLEPEKTGCLDVQVLRLTRQDTLAPPAAGNTEHAHALMDTAGDTEGQPVQYDDDEEHNDCESELRPTGVIPETTTRHDEQKRTRLNI
ncbi:hypothetical protein C8Q80DRAFT_1147293 [Daedaleopsis nitida]|nr:hypothetical protein C8Q80DRAFT_1147293 [Daedaleopsis nitida]